VTRAAKKADRVAQYLYEIAPDEVNVKTISRVLRINHGTLRKEIRRMLAKKDTCIICTHRGFYRHKVELDLIARLDKLKRIELHGIQFLGVCRLVNTGYSFSKAAQHQYRKRGTYKEVFEDRILTITVHSKGTVQIFVNASGHPLTFPEFDRLQTYVKAKFDFVDEYSWKLCQIGLNVDQRQIGLEGVTSVRLAVFRNAWFQVYQKGEDTVRWEAHMNPDLKLDEAVFILRQLVETKIPAREIISERVPEKEEPKAPPKEEYIAPPEPDKWDSSYH